MTDSLFDPPLADGVYLGLPAEAYFRQECRGSSDWIKVHKRKLGWWWSSPYNPHRKREKTAALNYGSALHSIMLEGLDAYRRAFAVQPDPDDFDSLVKTIPEMKLAMAKAGFDLKGTSGFSKEQWAREMRENLPEIPCWPNIEAAFLAEAGERPIVTAHDDRMLRLMHQIAVDPERADNAHIRRLLVETESTPLVEVSVFATVQGIRRRWRFDRMFPALTMDLKSLGNWGGRPLTYEVGEVLARNGWDIQRADYHVGREQAYRLVREGALFGGSLEERRYLEKIVDENPSWDWLWLVYQKPDPKGQAPVIFPLWDDTWEAAEGGGEQPSAIHLYGRNKLNKAIMFYRAAVAQFGLEQPWASVEALHYTSDAETNRVIIPSWIADEVPVDAPAYGHDEPAESAA